MVPSNSNAIGRSPAGSLSARTQAQLRAAGPSGPAYRDPTGGRGAGRPPRGSGGGGMGGGRPAGENPSARPGPANPLVRMTGLQELLQREARTPTAGSSIDNVGVVPALTSHVRAAWGRNKLAKQKIELKLLDCLRARRGVYSPAAVAQMQQAGGGLNMVWDDLTETKCRAASAWIREIVLSPGEDPWGLEATSKPDLPRPIKDGIVRKALKQAQQVMAQIQEAGGDMMEREEFHELAVQLGDKLREEAEVAVQKVADRRAARMKRQIKDRMQEGDYESAMDAFVEDFVTYPAALVKGPVYQRKLTLQWGEGWEPKVANNPVQTWARVSPFDAYPAPSAIDCQAGDFIERVRYRREELHDLKGLPDYKDAEIDKALRDYSNGHLEGWLWTDSERQRLEQESMFMFLSPPGVIDALNYWGSVPGWKLMSWGVTLEGETIEPTQEYECNVLLCGQYVLYATINPNPLRIRPYHKACYDEIPGAFWGRSIPELASTSQKMCNATASALADNLGMASGPQVWVHADRFADGESSIDIFPWKVWQLKSDPTQGVNPGIGFFQPNDNSEKLLMVHEKFSLKADDATGIPRYTYGNERAGGSANTATGLSMLMNNAAKGLRRAISNIDRGVISPTVSASFMNEMLYNPDDSIKGDCVIVPRGANAILIKEASQQRRVSFLTMVAGSPALLQVLGTKHLTNLVREVATSMELPVDDVVPSEEEAEQQAAAQAQMAQQQNQQLAEQEAIKTQAEGQRGVQSASTKLIADVARQVISQVTNPPQPPGQEGAPGGAPAPQPATAEA